MDHIFQTGSLFTRDYLTEAVTLNRARVAASLELAPEALVSVHQVHSPDVVHVKAPLAEKPMADAMVTDKAGLGLAILTADCQPVLFADPVAGVIGAAHAGWKGALGGVGDATVVAMEKLGGIRENIIASVGPCIAQKSYEVGPEFPTPFLVQDKQNASFFQAALRPGHHMFDIGGYNMHRLNQLGLASVDWVQRDTCAEVDVFYSYRRSTLRREPDYGRQLSAIKLER